MPQAHFHIALSAALFAFASPFIRADVPATFALFLFSGMAPDLDNRRSVVRKSLMLVLPLALSFAVATQSSADSAARFVAAMVAFVASGIIIAKLPLNHRGRRSLHQWWLVAPAGLTGMLAAQGTVGSVAAFAAAAGGYLSHLVADKLFNKGHQL